MRLGRLSYNAFTCAEVTARQKSPIKRSYVVLIQQGGGGALYMCNMIKEGFSIDIGLLIVNVNLL